MKKIFNVWSYGLSYLLYDELVSFYVFFTMIFAGCVWLFSCQDLNVAIPLTLIMLGYIANVMLFSWLKGNWEGTRREKTFSICYAITFTILFVIGSIVNATIHFAMLTIILVVTAICVWIREFQLSTFFQCIIIVGPIAALAICFAELSWLPVAFRIIIPAIYVICSPLIAYYEDYTASQNIFELLYEVTWNPEFEKKIRQLDNSDKDIVV